MQQVISGRVLSYTQKNGRTATMGYYPVPADVTEDPERLAEWAEKALQVARRKARAGNRGTRSRSGTPRTR